MNLPPPALHAPRRVTAATRGATAAVTVRNSGDAPLPGGYTVGMYESYNGLVSYVEDDGGLGSVTADAPLAPGERRTFVVPLSFAPFADLGPGTSEQPGLFAAVDVGHATRRGGVVRRRHPVAYADVTPGLVVYALRG